MSKAKKEEKAETRMQHETCCCPFCSSSRLWEKKKKEDYSGFFNHLRNARVEVLRALKSIIDDRISSLEQGKKKVTKIKVD